MLTGKIRELKAYWRQRIEDACAVYIHATAQHTQMAQDLEGRFIAPADGSFAVASARRAEAWALHELNRTMRIWADLMARGIVPPPDEDEKLIV